MLFNNFSKLIFIYIFLISCEQKKQPINENSTAFVETIEIQNLMKPIDSFIQDEIKKNGIIGLSAAIIVNKKLRWIKGYGHADKENQTAFTENTIMNIASISKTFTGASIMHAVENGLLSLDEDINTYLPFKVINPYFPNEKITLRHIATHTSTLADDYDIYDKTYFYNSKSPEELAQFLENYFVVNGKYYSKKNFINKNPGSYRDYSNIAAGLAGYILEIKSGKKLNDYCKEYIFNPLEMINSGWFISEVDLTNHSKQYEKVADSLKTIPLFQITTYPDGGVRTSVSELSRFFIALLNDGEYKSVRILNQLTVQEMLKFQFTQSNKPENIDLVDLNKNSGIFWSTKRNVTRIGHGGSDFGVSTEMFSSLSKKVAVILFSNTSEARTKDIYDELWKYAEIIYKNDEEK